MLNSKRASDMNLSTDRRRSPRGNSHIEVRRNSLTASSRYSVSHQKHHKLKSEQYQEKMKAQSRLETLRHNEIKIKNRVNLLENEEKRILKKVEETRKRAAAMKTIKE